MKSKQPETAQQVFHGWKDIAHYLSIGVRTAQRYERELGLPIRRPSGHPPGSVMAAKDELDFWVGSRTTAQESFNNETRAAQGRLVSEIGRGLQDRTGLQAQMTELRKELRASVSKVRENVLKLRQQMNELRRRQESIASVIKDHSKRRALLSVNGKSGKPN